MNCGLIVFWSVFVLLPSCLAQVNRIDATSAINSATHVFRYTNPITRDTAIAMRDHCILKVGNQWFCTGTSLPVWTGPNPGVRLLVSDDLIHWRQHSWLIDASTLPPRLSL
jgi:xylan 1,4-beta-xylosidase